MAYYSSKDSELSSWQYDNEEIYNSIESQMAEIETVISTLYRIDDFATEFDNMIEHLETIDGYAYQIYNLAKQAKKNGISNEDSLREGNELIKDLQEQLTSLSKELEDVENRNINLKSDIDGIQQQINVLEIQLDQIASDMAIDANMETKRLILSRRHGVICSAHDSIVKESSDIEDFTADARNYLRTNVDINDNANNGNVDIAPFLEKISNALYAISDDLNQAKNMNERMGSGIVKKNELIEKLRNDIDDIGNQIEKSVDNKSDLEVLINELNLKLNALEIALS